MSAPNQIHEVAAKLRLVYGPMTELVLLVPIPMLDFEVELLREAGISVVVDKYLPPGSLYMHPKRAARGDGREG